MSEPGGEGRERGPSADDGAAPATGSDREAARPDPSAGGPPPAGALPGSQGPGADSSFAGLLFGWPDRELERALAIYAADYQVPRLEAIRAELRRRSGTAGGDLPQRLRAWPNGRLVRALRDLSSWSDPERWDILVEAARRRLTPPQARDTGAVLGRTLVELLRRPGLWLAGGVSSIALVGFGWGSWWLVDRLEGQRDPTAGVLALLAWPLGALLLALNGATWSALAWAAARRRSPSIGEVVDQVPVAVLGGLLGLLVALPAAPLICCGIGLLPWLYLVDLPLVAGAGAVALALEAELDPLGAWGAWRSNLARARGAWLGAAARAWFYQLLTLILTGLLASYGGVGKRGVGVLVALAPLLIVVLACLLGVALYLRERSRGLRAGRDPVALYRPPPRPDRPLRWGGALALLLPLSAPGWVAALQPGAPASSLLSAAPLGAGLAVGSVILVALVGGLGLLRLAQLRCRAVALDEGGLWIGPTSRWRGVRIPWDRVRDYRVDPDGVRLRTTGRWGRWPGVVVPARDREVHDLVERLQALNIPARAD